MLYQLAFLTAIISALMEAIRRAIKLNEQYIPLGSVVLGLILAFIVRNSLSIPETIVMGLVLGLCSCGLLKGIESGIYATKKIIQKAKNKESI